MLMAVVLVELMIVLFFCGGGSGVGNVCEDWGQGWCR